MKLTRRQLYNIIKESLILEVDAATKERAKKLAGTYNIDSYSGGKSYKSLKVSKYGDAIYQHKEKDGKGPGSGAPESQFAGLLNLIDSNPGTKVGATSVDLSGVEGYWQDKTNDEAFIRVIQNPVGRRPNIQVYSYKEGDSQAVTKQRLNQASPSKLEGYKESIKGGLWQKLSKFPWMSDPEVQDPEVQDPEVQDVDGEERDSAKKPSSSGSGSNTVREIQKIIDRYEVVTKHDGKWKSQTQQAWENYVNDQPKGAKDKHGGTVKGAPSFKAAFTAAYPDKDFEAIKKTILTDWKGTAKKLGYSKGNASDLLDFLKKIHTTKPGTEKETEVSEKEPAEKGKSRETANKGNQQQKKLPVTLLTDEQAADSFYVQKFYTQMQNDIMKSQTGDRRQDRRKEKEIGSKYGLTRQDNDIFIFKTSGGKRIKYNSKSKAIISEGLSRGALYRQRYYGRY